MESVIFECESITPMFMYGANQNRPEFRATSIKGALRFWWRAINGDKDIGQLRKDEEEIFGSTEKKSKVKVRLTNVSKVTESFQNIINEVNSFEGIKYNFYHLFIEKEKNNKKYMDSVKFDLNIYSSDVKALKETINSIIILNFFGGIGLRSRRGAGSLKFKVKENKKELFKEKLELLETKTIKSKEDLKSHYLKIKKELNICSTFQYTSLFKSIYIFDYQEDWKKALNLIAKSFSDFRKKHKSEVLKTPNFGFPIIHRSNETKYVGGEISKENKLIKEIERRASPLIFKIIKIDEKKYFPIIIFMEGDLLPKGFEIIGKEKKDKKYVYRGKKHLEPSYEIVEDFLNKLKKETYIKVDYNE